MNIVDSHVHYWDPGRLKYGWLQNEPLLYRAYLTDHVPPRVGDWNVQGIVFVQADCAPEQGLDEVNFVTELAKQDQRIKGIVAFAPIEQPQSLQPYLISLQAQPLVRGVRRLIQDEPLGFALQPIFVAGIQALAAFDFTFDLCVKHWQLPDVVQLVRLCPQVQFVLDHIGKPDIKNNVLEPWRTHVAELAALPNVSCKLSGLVTEAHHADWQIYDLQPFIDHILATFGIDRVMFGSDAPVAYLASTYARWVETLAAATAVLSPADRQKMWHHNAASFYRL
jgi:L-fuconolactonase